MIEGGSLGSSAEGGWTVTLHRRNKPNTCHRADFQQLVVQRDGAYVTRRRTHLLFCIQTGKRWRYCHENSKTPPAFVAFISSTVQITS